MTKIVKKLMEKLRNLFAIINDCFKQTKDLKFLKNLHNHVSENIPYIWRSLLLM